MRAVALIALIATLGCHDSKSPVNPTPASSPAASVPMTLSGTVFEVLPGTRVPAPGVSLMAVVVADSSCSPPCVSKRTWVREETTSGPDGRYHFPVLPPGPAIVLASSSAHQQVCGAATTLTVATQLDVEVTSKSNPQPSPTKPPLTITGQVYETTPSGRVGLDGASIYVEWIAPDSPFMTFNADKNGRFTACGIPANTEIAFWTFKTGYNDPYDWHQFSRDSTVDIELTRR